MSRGFTFIQLSILLTVTSLALVACLPSLPTNQALSASTSAKMNTILTVLRQFESANARLPCPADASLPLGSAMYGMEAANAGATGNCTGGSPAANFVDAANHVAVGMLPVRALGLSASYALDGWGRNLTYAVDTQASSCFQGTLAGAIAVTDNGGAHQTSLILVSHGMDGHGAWLPQTGAGAGMRLNAGASDTDELTNAHVTAGFTPTLPLSHYVRKPPTPTFDDILAYQTPLWDMRTLPAAAAGVFPQLGTPASATYIAGETLTFTLTYPQAVAVSGTPQLALTMGAATRYAGYIGGSGTTVLTFRYTLAPGDYAPTGIIVTSPVNVTSGTLSYSCNSFTSSPLTGVTVKNVYLYVADAGNNRVEEFTSGGVYLGKFGMPGVFAGQFLTPKQPVADASGNIWVTDSVNARVEEFNAAGTYVTQFGSLGIANGQFGSAGSAALDASGNFWVADEGGGRIEKFSGTGAYLAKFGSLGVANGQFLLPKGLAFDAAGNIWAGDFTGNRLQKFTSAGVYLTKFGTTGTGNGQFLNPCGQAVDSTGNIWVADSGNNRVQKFDAGGNYLGKFGTYGTGSGQLNAPCGIAIDAADTIWVSDTGNNRVQEFSASGLYLGQFGSYGTGNGKFILPGGIGLMYQ